MTTTDPDPDVLIVGAGPTGAVAAKRFVEAGMRVVVLEQGDWPDYSKARADNPDFELTMGRYWSGNPNRRQAAADYPIDDTDSDISAVLYSAVGGGTVIYAAHWQRNMPSDFRVRCGGFGSSAVSHHFIQVCAV
jgi:choline dehydrogenase-like flavoprotein